ncbi:MAG TPA: hypothetical protein DCX96_00475 [Oscillibacter sp.]|nr:hypothetical protein [Oscillibacter sp.]
MGLRRSLRRRDQQKINRRRTNMKMTKKITALLLALVMALSLSTMAFANGTTTTTTGKVTRTTVNSIDAVSSITIGGTTAYYEKDSNTGDQIYIRAMVAGGTENGLKSTNVVINLSNAGATINGDLSFTGAGNVRTATNVNLLNKVYTVIISTSEGGVTTSKTYKLAAGLPNGAVAIASGDPLRISTLQFGDVEATFTATNAQNPLMGNTVSNTDGKWTFVSYKATATMDSVISNRTAVPAYIEVPTGTTVSGGCLGETTVSGEAEVTLNLSDGTPFVNVTKGSETRKYFVFATDPGTFTVKYGIDFTEAMADSHYTGTVKTAVDTLNTQAKEFFGITDGHAYGERVVNSGETVMDIMHKFAVKYSYTSEVPEGCTYMATLNGIGEFTFGQYSGWMYTDGPTWVNGAADYTKWNTPAVGGASYTLSAGDEICWFICCNYMHHPWG